MLHGGVGCKTAALQTGGLLDEHKERRQACFYKGGGPYADLLADVPSKSSTLLITGSNGLCAMAPCKFPNPYYPFSSNSTLAVVGNAGEAGSSPDIAEIDFLQRALGPSARALRRSVGRGYDGHSGRAHRTGADLFGELRLWLRKRAR